MMNYRQMILVMLLVVLGADLASARHSWELPGDDEVLSIEDIPADSPDAPDCKYSFEADGLYYWISDEAEGTVMLVNTNAFYARQYLYKRYAGYPYLSCPASGYEQTELTIPAEVSHKGRTYTVTCIGYAAFKGSQNLQVVFLPETVESVWEGAFYDCPRLSSVQLSPKVDYLNYGTFQMCPSMVATDLSFVRTSTTLWHAYSLKDFGPGPKALTHLTLPYAMNEGATLDARFFCELRYLKSHNPEPPAYGIMFEQEVYDNAVLHVPPHAGDAYRAAEGWSRFANIKMDDEIMGVEETAVPRAFNLNGHTIKASGAECVCVYRPDGTMASALLAGGEHELAPGLYIIKSPSGEASKILIR